jgi:multiple sugar transport system ATP-binding protein
MGSDVFIYFTQDGGLSATTDQLADLAQDSGKDDVIAGDETVTARLDPVTRIKEGDEAELWADIRTMHIFDPDTGKNLSLGTEPGTKPAETPAPPAT